MENFLAVTGMLAIIGIIISISIAMVSFANYKSLSRKSLCNTVSLHSDKGLAKQGLFWVVIAAPSLHFLFFGYLAWRDYSLSLNAYGYSTFYRISAVPLSLLALSVPLTALVAKLHSTAQAAKQILIAEEKNKHDLFYLHRREFVQYFQNMDATLGDIEISYKISARVHGQLFTGEPSEGTPKLQAHALESQISKFKKAEQNLLKALTAPEIDDSRTHYISFCRDISALLNFLSIRDVNFQLEKCAILISDSQRSIGSSVEHAVTALECVRVYLVNIINFAGYKPGIEKMNLEKINFYQALRDQGTNDNLDKILSKQ